MRVLVTAGSTQAPIDQVRSITNPFSGRTGARIALCGHDRGHDVCLLTSRPAAVGELRPDGPPPERWAQRLYQTYGELAASTESAVRSGRFDAVVHSAAVSDYLVDGVYAPAPGTSFNAETGQWTAAGSRPPGLEDRRAGKVRSDLPEVWLRLRRAPKLVDRVRSPWGFRGVLVKFKLEVGVSEATLREIAEESRRQSHADLLVANTLEGAADWALLGPVDGRYARLSRAELPGRLWDQVEMLYAGRDHD
jgi:phosphopantothenoylcysteine synthetase/decarboxylase